MTPTVYSSHLSDLDPATLYGMLRLRVDVFVVEQECAYPELDGRDLEPGTVHYWCTDDADDIVATARLLTDRTELRIGRVCVHPDRRGAGVTRLLLDRIVADIGDRPSVLDAQAHLEGMYARWGYAAYGPEFVEDGIPHIPMRRVTA